MLLRETINKTQLPASTSRRHFTTFMDVAANAWYQIFGIKYLVPNTWYLIFGTKNLVPSACQASAPNYMGRPANYATNIQDRIWILACLTAIMSREQINKCHSGRRSTKTLSPRRKSLFTSRPHFVDFMDLVPSSCYQVLGTKYLLPNIW